MIKRYKEMALIGMALTLAAGLAIGWIAGNASAKETAADASDAGWSEPAETPVPVATSAPSAADLWSDDRSRIDTPLLATAELAPETQWAIFEACGQDAGTFCITMAIAYIESHYDTDLIGDDGQSFGMMQINTKWHTDRMERLGVTDLTDPVQCATVAIDYLRELDSRYGFEPESDAILMAYNMGPTGARNAMNAGRTSTDYSTAVLKVYRDYLEEMEWAR